MRLFDDDPGRPPRSDAGWEQYRQHRTGQSGPPRDEVGVLARAWSLQDFGRSPGRFRLGCAFADGRRATTGESDSPDVETPGDETPHLVLLDSTPHPLSWAGDYWLHPLPPEGSLVIGCRWPDRRIPEMLAQLEAEPLLTAAHGSRPVWEGTP